MSDDGRYLQNIGETKLIIFIHNYGRIKGGKERPWLPPPQPKTLCI